MYLTCGFRYGTKRPANPRNNGSIEPGPHVAGGVPARAMWASVRCADA